MEKRDHLMYQNMLSDFDAFLGRMLIVPSSYAYCTVFVMIKHACCFLLVGLFYVLGCIKVVVLIAKHLTIFSIKIGLVNKNRLLALFFILHRHINPIYDLPLFG